MRQYIGARYVPKFFENSATGDSTWAANIPYEPLTIVSWNGLSYTSKKPVTANIGNPSDNDEYWVITGSNSVSSLTQRVETLEEEVDSLEDDVDDAKTAISILNSVAKRNFILLGDSYSIGYTTVDGTNYVQSEWGWANKTKAILTSLGHKCYTSNDIQQPVSGTTGFNSTLPFITLLQDIEPAIDVDFSEITDIVVLGGVNDLSYTTGLATAVGQFCDYAHQTFPNADVRIGCIGNKVYELTSSISPAYQNCIKHGCTFIRDLLNMMTDPAQDCVDGTHLTANGYLYYYPYIFEAIMTGHCFYRVHHAITLTNTGDNIGTAYTLWVESTPAGTYLFFDGDTANENLSFYNMPSKADIIYNMSSELKVPRYASKIADGEFWCVDTSAKTTKYIAKCYPYVQYSDKTHMKLTWNNPLYDVPTGSFYYVQFDRAGSFLPMPI